MFASILFILTLAAICPVAYWFYLQYKFRSLNKIPGPKPTILLGNTFSGDSSESFEQLKNYTKQYGNVMKIWIGPNARVVFADPDHIEAVLSSTEHITKSDSYKLVVPWLGEALLLLTCKKIVYSKVGINSFLGSAWKQRRKMLTPSFHFKILERFMDVFNESSNRLVQCLEKVSGKEVDIYNFISLHSLDIICETSMGTKINALENKDNKYVTSVLGMLHIFGERFLSAWKRVESLYVLFADNSAKYKNNLATAHAFTNEAVRKKLQDTSKHQNTNTEEYDGIKPKLALIDTLIKPENGLSKEDIRAEIDTFMFEGHDTTASGTSFCLYALSKYPEIQSKVYEEIEAVVGSDNIELTINHLNEMKYLDMVLKEYQRVYPSVPLIERKLEKQFEINGTVYPKDTTLMIFIYQLHQNSKSFPDPDKFDPYRFLPENISKRHNFSYVPFSAGPRNCIGQKFAIFEMKTTVIKILQKFKVAPVIGHELKLSGLTGILKSSNGIKVKLLKR